MQPSLDTFLSACSPDRLLEIHFLKARVKEEYRTVPRDVILHVMRDICVFCVILRVLRAMSE